MHVRLAFNFLTENELLWLFVHHAPSEKKTITTGSTVIKYYGFVNSQKKHVHNAI